MSIRLTLMVLIMGSVAVLSAGCSSEPSTPPAHATQTSLGSGDRVGRALYARQNVSVKAEGGGTDLVRIFADE